MRGQAGALGGGEIFHPSTLATGSAESGAMGIPVTGVSELVLEVVDLEAAEAFYAGLLGLPVVERWPDRDAIWLMAGDRTRIGLWRPQVGLEQGRGGVHVHFAMHIAEADYDAAVAELRAKGAEVAEHAFGDPPALARRLPRRPRRPPRRALDLGRGRPPHCHPATQSSRCAGERAAAAAVAATSRLWTLIFLPPSAELPAAADRRRETPAESSSIVETVRSTIAVRGDPVHDRLLAGAAAGRPAARRVEQRPGDREVGRVAQVEPGDRLGDRVARVARASPCRKTSSRGPSRPRVYSTTHSSRPRPYGDGQERRRETPARRARSARRAS